MLSQTRNRVIYHIDCNGFYASVECLDNPELRRVPLAVAGDPKDRSGIILAKNELAKGYGVQTAETIWKARRKCPGLVLVPPRHDRYEHVSRLVKALFAQYTDQVESFGLDEAWLDVTGSLGYFGMTAAALADAIRERVKREIGITVSVGVSFNKVFAKLGSDMKKPDATTVITADDYKQKVWPLKAKNLLFVGRVAEDLLEKHFIYTIGDVARHDRDDLVRLFGKGGDAMWIYANGLDSDPVKRIGDREPVKSIGNGMTFRRDLVGEQEIKAGVIALSDEVARRMRRESVKCRTISVSIKNPALKTISRQISPANPTRLQKEIVDAAMALIRANWNMNSPIRAITITAMNLLPDSFRQEQLSLFDMLEADESASRRERQEKLENAIAAIREKHGTEAVGMGYVQSEELGIVQFRRKQEQ